MSLSTRASSNAFGAFTEGRRLEKTRFRIPHGKHTVEVDVYEGHLAGLLVAEVEFSADEEAASFVPAAWFGREVTDDCRYRDQALASLTAPAELLLG